MTEIEYIPQGTAEKPSPFEGSVIIKMPRQKERIAMIKELKFKPNGEGAIDVNENEGFDLAEKMIDIVEKHVGAIAVVHKSSGKTFSSLAELELYQEGTELISEIGNVVLSGIKLGNA